MSATGLPSIEHLVRDFRLTNGVGSVGDVDSTWLLEKWRNKKQGKTRELKTKMSAEEDRPFDKRNQNRTEK